MASSRAALLAFLVLVILIALSGALLMLSRPEPIHITINPPAPTATPSPTSTPPPIMVYVTGEVARRGTQHVLPHGSRVSDAVAAAGGFTSMADKELVNLAGILRDGDQVHVPSIESDRDGGALPTPSGGNLVNVNMANLEELVSLPNIGAVTAQSIIDYRQQVGPFSQLADLDDVPGIGPATLERLQGLVSFD